MPTFRFRVLFVDDEPAVRTTSAAVLESSGYEVLTAADGLEGLHALDEALPDLIISDLRMPNMSGFEFLAVVRNRFPQIPIDGVLDQLGVQQHFFNALDQLVSTEE